MPPSAPPCPPLVGEQSMTQHVFGQWGRGTRRRQRKIKQLHRPVTPQVVRCVRRTTIVRFTKHFRPRVLVRTTKSWIRIFFVIPSPVKVTQLLLFSFYSEEREGGVATGGYWLPRAATHRVAVVVYGRLLRRGTG